MSTAEDASKAETLDLPTRDPHPDPASLAVAAYEQRLLEARQRFAESRFVTDVIGRRLDDARFEAFLMYFTALGVQMTRPVESWIRRAGERCLAVGCAELGQSLVKHAVHEAGHDVLFEQDARSLVKRWNAKAPRHIDAARLLALPATAGVARYVQLHEDTIAGPSPFAQIAIEYEIEQLSVTWGPRFIKTCAGVLGPDVSACLTFVHDHVALDVGHTQFNRTQLGRFLAAHPASLDALAAAGSAALAAYGGYLSDCLELAEAQRGYS